MIRPQVPLVWILGFLCTVCIVRSQNSATEHNASWYASDRAEKVATLIPGRQLPNDTPDTLFAEWTAQRVKEWNAEHPPLPSEEAYRIYSETEPTDAELVEDFPRHISPFGRVRSGKPDPWAARYVLIKYCPFCGSRSLRLNDDPNNPYHATTGCCGTELYVREKDLPQDYLLKPGTTVDFPHLDDTIVSVPCTVYRDSDGVEWELFIKTVFDQKRWLSVGGALVRSYGEQFRATGDPCFAHKIALLLDYVSDAYYGLPLSYMNELYGDKENTPLTRAEWEKTRPPGIFELGELKNWNRRTPIFNKGWINMSDEHIWVESFARVRHHPAFKYYSQRKYGDPDALDRKVTTKLLHEVALMFRNCFSQKLLTNYQEANYVHLWLLGILVQDPLLIDFAGPAQEVAMYNHTYQDGLNGEGAPNYMAMPGGYFYPYLRDPNGWLEFYPQFLAEHPFYWAANNEMRKLKTIRGMPVEFGDQHEYACPSSLFIPLDQVKENEQISSRNWAGYGVGILRVGGPGHRQEICLSYTRATLHNSQDALSIGCWFDGVPIMRRGGYVAGMVSAQLQWDRPEHQALRTLGYPHTIEQSGRWAHEYAHTPLCQNGVTVDGVATGPGWGNNRGYGEVITYKGSEAAGEPGSGFQILDVRDHYSWQQAGRDVSDFRRTLLGIEGPNGRPYFIDIMALKGGKEHVLYQSAWAKRIGSNVSEPRSMYDSLADLFLDNDTPLDTPLRRGLKHVRNVELLDKPAQTWDVTWQTDMGAYAAKDLNTGKARRPLPTGVGTAKLRLIGIDTGPGTTELIQGKGPWIGRITQPLPNNQRIDGDVAFMDARDFLIERHRASDGQEGITSMFVHILEGFRHDEDSAIREAARLEASSLAGQPRDILALRLEMTAGHSDTILYQSMSGTIALPDGLETDARYAFVRRDSNGSVMAAHIARGTFLKCEGFSASLPGDFTGTIVDIVGDITGTRKESALIIKPDRPWPSGAALYNRQALIRFESDLRTDGNEGYRAQSVENLPDGNVRLNLQDHAPFITSWHQVTVLPSDRPNTLKTWRPMVDHGNNPWYNGLKIWFPEHNKTFTIKNVNRVGGGYGGDTLEVLDDVSLASEGIQIGDWYVIYGIEPGRRITIPGDFCWRREDETQWQRFTLRAPGTVNILAKSTQTPCIVRIGEEPWREFPRGKTSFTATETGGQTVSILTDAPEWLNLNDTAPPELLELSLDGKSIASEEAEDLGWIDPPEILTMVFRDDGSPLDLSRLRVSLNDRPLETENGNIVSVAPDQDGHKAHIQILLGKELAQAYVHPRRHTIRVEVFDRSADRCHTSITVSFINRVPLKEGTVYLSDLECLESHAHGDVIRDRDYNGGIAQIQERIYPKCITLCPERQAAGGGGYGFVVFALPKERKFTRFCTDIGISDSSADRGSVEFGVQKKNNAEADWKTIYTSPLIRGGSKPVSITCKLENAEYIKLYTTDGGDNINSDHALWGNARLE